MNRTGRAEEMVEVEAFAAAERYMQDEKGRQMQGDDRRETTKNGPCLCLVRERHDRTRRRGYTGKEND